MPERIAAQIRTCALEDCDEQFVPRNERQKYHSRTCARKASDRRRRAETKAALDAARPKTVDEQLAEQRRRDEERRHKAELRSLSSARVVREEYYDILRDALGAYDATPLQPNPHTHPGRPEHEWVLHLSDWHVGQKTTMAETGGLYEQDVSTTRAQVAELWRALSLVHEIETSGRRIDKLHVLSLGDFIDHDDMRPSQHRKVQDVMTVQTVQAFDLVAWLIRQCLTIIPEVEVDLVGGNHDRISRMRGDAGLGELDYIDTISWLVGAFLERTLASDVEAGRLKIRNWETFFGYKTIADRKWVFEHGSSFKWASQSYGGVPWYGVQNLGPKYESMLGGADVVSMGHGHRAAILPNGRNWVVVNGALPATSTYVQAGMKAVQRPLQWLLSVHKEIGITGFHPLYADVPEALLPGMVWEDPSFYADKASGKESAPFDMSALESR